MPSTAATLGGLSDVTASTERQQRLWELQLGERVQRILLERRVDAEVRPGKTTTAFCAFMPADVGPYLLLSYNGRRSSSYTLAHELGHALHCELAAASQPFYQAEAGVAVAEIASLFAEELLFAQMSRQRGASDRLGVLAAQIEAAVGGVFIQVLMARFEQRAYALRREGKTLQPERLTEIWRSEMQNFFGDSVLSPGDLSLGWCYVSHFYFARFYTYSYALAYFIALALLERADAPDFGPRYRAFLSAGASASPADLLRPLGIDLDDPSAVFDNALRALERLLDEAEELAAASAREDSLRLKP